MDVEMETDAIRNKVKVSLSPLVLFLVCYLPFPVLSCLVLSCRVVSCRVVSCRVLSCFFVSFFSVCVIPCFQQRKYLDGEDDDDPAEDDTDTNTQPKPTQLQKLGVIYSSLH
jgi:hypothetical protein